MRLQLRLFLFLLLPVALILTGVGVAGYHFSQQLILKEWRKGAIVKLQWAAHHIDMRLQRPLHWMQIFQTTGDLPQGAAIQSFIIEQIEAIDGVDGVTINWEGQQAASPMNMRPMDRMGRMGFDSRSGGQGTEQRPMGIMRFHQARIARVSAPNFDVGLGEKTVRVVAEFLDATGRQLGEMKIRIRFASLMRNILELGWWQTEEAYLIDEMGCCILAGSGPLESGMKLGENGSRIESRLLESIRQNDSGTVVGKGFIPDQVGGFYNLEQAPWSLVLIAPGHKVFAFLLQFRNVYLLVGAGCIVAIVLMIQLVSRRAVKRIKLISGAAESVSRGDYGQALPENGPRDEIGRLTRDFNQMVQGLRERDFIRNTFGRYVDQEIAAELMARPEAAKLGGDRREVAMLMSDLRGFTQLAESLRPEETVTLLNRYFDQMISVILEHKGIIVDFFGDALLVFFDPLGEPVQPSVKSALHCAFAMQARLQPYNTRNRAAGLPEFQMGIGLHAGEVVVGNIGSEARAKYGIVGSAVNLTSRIQARAGEGEILVSEAVYDLVQDEVTAGIPRDVQLKGIPESVRLYPVT
ncbi:MAG: HAMP domain-containing protein [Desulfohalobiaceae bacterium]|nr:HAMP domain-containing protein [Desulfohalobiaceae bacterium]